jgi:hypothetical protein
LAVADTATTSRLDKCDGASCFIRRGIGAVTLREERRLRVFEGKVVSKVLGLRRREVTGDWRKVHNEELHDLYSTPGIMRVMTSPRMN